MLAYRKNGKVRQAEAVGVQGAGVVVRSQSTGDDGLSQESVELVMVHDAVHAGEWCRQYQRFGGEAVVDENGDPIWKRMS